DRPFGGRLDAGLYFEGPTAVARADRLEQRHHELVVVVARHDGDALVAGRLADATHHGDGVGQDVCHRPLSELDQVAQQHDLVDVRQSAGTRVEDASALKEVTPARQAEVEVRVDRRAHPLVFARRGWVPCIATP